MALTMTDSAAAAKRARARLTQLRRRRERLEADSEQLRADTLTAVAAGRPYCTYEELAELTGLSRPRIAQLLAQIKGQEPD